MKLIDNILIPLVKYYPFTRGRMFFYLHFVHGKSRSEVLDRLPNPIRMKGGFYLHTYESGDFTSLWFRLYRHYEQATKKLILGGCERDSIFLDVGANLGVFSLGIAKRRKDLLVVGIEPNPLTFSLLSKSVKDNRLCDRVKCLKVAAGNSNEESQFIINLQNSGDSVLMNEGDRDSNSKTVDVEIRKLDEYEPLLATIRASGRKISCLKMDIQGAEVLALQGMSDIITTHKPLLIVELAEDCLARFGHTAKDLYDQLELLNYHQVDFVESNIIARSRS